MSLKDEQMALQPPFTIGPGYQYRDASGTYACPHCHWDDMTRRIAKLVPGMTECPSCHAALLWEMKR